MQTHELFDVFHKCFDNQGLFKEIRDTEDHYFAEAYLRGTSWKPNDV